jgi:hypothetical protein
MVYQDGEVVEIGDRIEVNDMPDEYEPEEAIVIKIGKIKLQAELTNECIKNRKIWLRPDDCSLIARSM